MKKKICAALLLAAILGGCGTQQIEDREDTAASVVESAAESAEGSTEETVGSVPEEPIYWETEQTATIFKAPEKTWGTGVSHPTILEIQHNEEYRGTLLASFAVYDSGLTGTKCRLRVMASTDGGATWTLRGGGPGGGGHPPGACVDALPP